MKNLYFVLLLVYLPLFINSAFAQCDDVNLESLTNPGAFVVETLTEADGIRNGPDYLGATIYYPTNAKPPFASIAIVPGFVSLPSSIEEWGTVLCVSWIVPLL